jgi:hypothetical protein
MLTVIARSDVCDAAISTSCISLKPGLFAPLAKTAKNINSQLYKYFEHRKELSNAL